MVMGMREKLIELLREGIRYDTEKKEAWIVGGKVGTKPNVFENMADYLIANGVRIPVQCKDCKHMEITPDCLRWCNVWNGINGMGDEGFCNYGERKGNDCK